MLCQRMSKRFLLAILVLVACSREQPQTLRNANVLLITLDTTRADRLGAYGYAQAATPNLDRLAAEGVLFEQCVTPSGFTLPSHSTIMTGLYPPAHGVRLNGDAALGDVQTTLAERLKAKGYRTGAFVSAFVLDGRWGLSQGFDHYDDKFHIGADQRLDLARVQRPGNVVTDLALEWLEQEKDRPFFAWVHMYDAHSPYEPPAPLKGYDGEITFADTQVGRLLQWLDRSGHKDNTIVIITADHGEGLGSHGEDEHGYFVYDYAVHVPLILRLPGTAGRRIGAQVRTADIMPTILEAVGGETASGIDGQSLLPLVADPQREHPKYAYSEAMSSKLQYGWAALYSLRTVDHKFIEAPRSELYDLRSDPGETTNRLDDQRRVARELKDALQRIRDDAGKRAPKHQEANLDPETVQKLASLGYLGGGSAAARDDKDLADPKDKLHLYESVGYAAVLMLKSDYKQAVQVLEIVLDDDPDVAQAQLLISQAYRKTGRSDKAKVVLDTYLKSDPANTRALVAMAEILLDEDRGDDVIAICRKALASDAQNARAYELMADVYIVRNDHQGAIPLLQKAVAIQPKLTRSRNNLAASLIGAGRYDEAEKLLAEIIQQYPKFPLAHYHRGLLREAQKRFGEARAEYAREVENHPKSTVARFNFGNLLLRLGDTEGAEKEMRALIAQDPSSARPYLLLGQALLDRPGHLAEVEKLALAGLERAKDADLKALGYFLLADVYSREGRRAELQDALRKGEYYRALIRS
jgi:arylsulfatase A-like enzyme/tetratricopeptide (TPR) repeat protein